MQFRRKLARDIAEAGRAARFVQADRRTRVSEILERVGESVIARLHDCAPPSKRDAGVHVAQLELADVFALEVVETHGGAAVGTAAVGRQHGRRLTLVGEAHETQVATHLRGAVDLERAVVLPERAGRRLESHMPLPAVGRERELRRGQPLVVTAPYGDRAKLRGNAGQCRVETNNACIVPGQRPRAARHLTARVGPVRRRARRGLRAGRR